MSKKNRLSLPSLNIEEKERIAAFSVTITCGNVISLPRVPIGWSIHIDNSPTWKTVVSGSISVGAAAMTHKETDFFKDFLVIESDPGGCPITIEGEMTTFFEGNSWKESHRVFKRNDFKLETVGE
jgi:hypothetical protein